MTKRTHIERVNHYGHGKKTHHGKDKLADRLKHWESMTVDQRAARTRPGSTNKHKGG